MNINSKWHHVDSLMPARGKYVLVETRYCKYPFITAYFNGIDWINADDKATIENVRYWADIIAPFQNDI